MRNRGRCWLALVVGVLIVTGLAACGSPATGLASSGSPTTGLVAGHVYVSAGLDPGPNPVITTVIATSADTAAKTWSTTTASDGTFAFDLPPGTYDVTWMAPSGWSPGGEMGSQRVTVAQGADGCYRFPFLRAMMRR